MIDSDQGFSTGVLQEFLKHAIPVYVGTDFFFLRLSKKKKKDDNTTIVFWYE